MTLPDSTLYRQRIGQAFSAAHDYDLHAGVQRRVAHGLAARIAGRIAGHIAAVPLPAAPRGLEIGCGTGFLTEALAELLPARIGGGEWLITDLSPVMVDRCRHRLGARPGWRYATLDGEHGLLPDGEHFDLIASSMTVQWFDDLPAAVARMLGWLAPGGILAFTTLTAGTFAEWRAAHEAEGLVPGTPELPPLETLRAVLPERQLVAHGVERLTETYGTARDFLHALKAIGAGTSARGHHPLPPEALRRVMRRFEDGGGSITYEVVTCFYRMPG